MHYVVLGGGISPEKEVSHRSAHAVQQALEALNHTVEYLDPAVASVDEITAIAQESDGVFPILHGIGGEDGTIQTILEDAAIPYFGPDPAACHTTFNKVDFKRLLEENGLPTPEWNTVTAETLAAEPLTNAPFVIKPITGGSSIDTFIVRSLPFDPEPLLEALGRYETMLIETLVEGSEITIGILENEALPVVEIIPPQDKEFDYENKYNGTTRELCPPENISDSLQQEAQALAIAAHTVTGGRHLSRTDILINTQGQLFIIDTNTIPGLTSQSLYPKAAAEAGYSWEQLVERFIELLA
ncbi:MAG: D-alanine--D-alanine ligase family protein [Candidatus Microsaccharimonas sp.]